MGAASKFFTVLGNKQKKRAVELYISDGSAATPERFYWLWPDGSRIVWG